MKDVKPSYAIVLAIPLIILVVSICPLIPVKAIADVTVTSHTGYLDSYGYYHVVGEIQNTGDQAINFVRVEVTFYNSSNFDIATRFDLTLLNVLLPDRTSPFDIFITDTTKSTEVNHYTLNTTYSVTDPLPIGLAILSHESYVDDTERAHITGEITNTADQKAENVEIIVTCYDNEQKVIATTLTHLDPIYSDLNPDQTEPFEIIFDEDITTSIIEYKLTAQSTQYAITSEIYEVIPEIATSTTIIALLILVTIILTLIMREPRPVKNL